MHMSAINTARRAHRYDLADYALDKATIDRPFGDYVARFDIALERI